MGDAPQTPNWSAVTLDEWVDEYIERQQKPLVVGEDVVPTMLPAWNRCSRDAGGGMGLGLGWHLIVAGNSGHGKSVFALNLAARALRSGVRTGFISLEMSVDQLATRFYAMLTGTPIRKLERGEDFDPDAAHHMRTRMSEILPDPMTHMVVNDELPFEDPLQDIHEITALMDEWIEALGCKLFVVDYMQLAGFGDEYEIMRRVMMISRAMKFFAKSRGVVTIGVSQFNRETSKNYDTSPRIQGLFGASGLENDAHQVMMIDHSRYRRVTDEQGNQVGAMTWALLGKNRHGPVTEIPVFLEYKSLRVREADPHEETEWPGYERRKGA